MDIVHCNSSLEYVKETIHSKTTTVKFINLKAASLLIFIISTKVKQLRKCHILLWNNIIYILSNPHSRHSKNHNLSSPTILWKILIQPFINHKLSTAKILLVALWTISGALMIFSDKSLCKVMSTENGSNRKIVRRLRR